MRPGYPQPELATRVHFVRPCSAKGFTARGKQKVVTHSQYINCCPKKTDLPIIYGTVVNLDEPRKGAAKPLRARDCSPTQMNSLVEYPI